MFQSLNEQPVDKIMRISQMYKADERAEKIDLGVGVYKDASGLTPVMRAVKAAERKLVEEQNSKVYVALAGDPEFADVMIDLVLGTSVPRANVAAAATPGGTGAVRQAFEMVKMATPDARVFVSNPTWPNHVSILNYLGLEIVEYRYFDEATRSVDFEAMMTDLGDAKPGDIILLHGCCHNPTGANLNAMEWQAVTDLLNRTGAIPMIDIAYQGFGDGLEEDAAATRLIASSVPECLIAASCSKNFGIYRERTGILMAVATDPARVKLAQGALTSLNRLNYSFPPDHGARVVTTILRDPALRAQWEQELEEVRLSMLSLRQDLANELRALSGSDRFAFIGQHRGMFSQLGTMPELVERLRAEHAIYMISDSRMNIAGLNKKTVPILAKAIIDTGI